MHVRVQRRRQRSIGSSAAVARATNRNADSLRVGELARATGFTAKTIRYYDEIGLVTPSVRSASGYRLYNRDAVERLRFVANARGLGLSLGDIRSILDITDSGEAPCGHVLSIVDRELAQVSAQLRRLHALQGDLTSLRGRLAGELAAGSNNDGRPGCRCLARAEQTKDGSR